MKECLVFGQAYAWNLCSKVHIELRMLILPQFYVEMCVALTKKNCFSYVVLLIKPLKNSGLKQ